MNVRPKFLDFLKHFLVFCSEFALLQWICTSSFLPVAKKIWERHYSALSDSIESLSYSKGHSHQKANTTCERSKLVMQPAAQLPRQRYHWLVLSSFASTVRCSGTSSLTVKSHLSIPDWLSHCLSRQGLPSTIMKSSKFEIWPLLPAQPSSASSSPPAAAVLAAQPTTTVVVLSLSLAALICSQIEVKGTFNSRFCSIWKAMWMCRGSRPAGRADFLYCPSGKRRVMHQRRKWSIRSDWFASLAKKVRNTILNFAGSNSFLLSQTENRLQNNC